MEANEMKTIVNKLRANPDYPEKFFLISRVINSIWMGVPIGEDDLQGERYEYILKYMATNAKNFTATSKSVEKLKQLIKDFCLCAHSSGIFVRNAVWLEKTFQVLVDMQRHSSLLWIGSFLALLFVEPLYIIHSELEKELASLVASQQSGTSIEEELTIVRSLWVATMEVVSIVLGYKISDYLFVVELRKVFKILGECDIIFKDEFFFAFYFKCLKTQNSMIISTVLDKLRYLFSDESVSDEGKASFMSYMIRGDAPNVLYVLAVHKTLAIVEKTLDLLIFIYRCDLQMTTWSAAQNCTIFLNIFRKSAKVRELTGQLMLIMLKKYSDPEKLSIIIDFYAQYKASPEEIPLLIDALWEFEFMKDIKNIKNHFCNPNCANYTAENRLRNAVVAHFCVAIVERLSPESAPTDFLRTMPRLVKMLRDSPIELMILLRIFSIKNVPRMYQILGDRKYLSQLLQQFRHIILHSTDYKCVLGVMNIFIEFHVIGYSEAIDGADDIKTIIFGNFVDVNLGWTTEEVDDQLFGDMEIASMRLSIFLSTKYKINENEINGLSKILIENIFTKNRFENTARDFSTIEIYHLESLSKLLLMKMLQIMTSSATDRDYIRSIKEHIFQVSSRLFQILNTESESCLFKQEKAIKNLVHLILSLKPSLQFSRQEELRHLADGLPNETFRFILEKCVEILCDDTRSDRVSIGFKQKILQHLSRLHRDYDGLESKAIEWKYYSRLLTDCKLVKEVDELFLAAAQFSSPFDKKFRRISVTLAAIFIRWGDERQNTRSIIGRLVNLFKHHMDDWQLLFEAIVVTTIASLVRRTHAIPPDRHRLLPLQLLKSFLIADNIFVTRVMSKLYAFGDDLRGDEKQTLKYFRQSIPK